MALPETTSAIVDETNRHVAQLRRAHEEVKEQVRLARALIHEARAYITRIEALDEARSIMPNMAHRE